ncbi:MAG: helix-turn-helix domain-containing protein [Azoarcus sp.]|nr:helix-turn-helix domain-containing protein [Azoarcus sp.]
MHHYLGSGLPDVWLENGYHIKQHEEHGEIVSVEDVYGLHRAIGEAVARNASPLSGAEFRFLRKELGMSQESLARLIGKSSQAVALWEKNGRVPRLAELVLRGIYLEAVTGSAEIMKQIEAINAIDRKRFERGGRLAMRFDEQWHDSDRAA